jgi:hypothetical protein
LILNLAGSQASWYPNTISVSLGDIYNQDITLDTFEPFQRFQHVFDVTSPTSTKLIFDHWGHDQVGLLLDNVKITSTLETDGDGIPDDKDACSFSDLNETVVIDGCDSGVENVLLEDGCTISDLILECADDADNHGEFVSAVFHSTKYLKKNGIISGNEKGKIQKCAAKADIP